ncbi:hypothetical protein Scep_001644 [Stephania cephalantha]|uniref:UBA domain-containing protein n=1 Tax=Stephania cephalantha TaxID=152367 RepID=A0AAP0L8G0_9MAGN
MTDQELELELNEAGTRLGDPQLGRRLAGDSRSQETSVSKGKNDKEQSGGQSSGSYQMLACGFHIFHYTRFTVNRNTLRATRGSTPQPPDFEAKVAKLTELGFGRDAVIQALQLFNGNEEQAAELVIGKLPLFTAVESLAHFLFLEDMLPVIEEILKHEWSARWQSFVPDLVSAAKTSETICENCMAILKVTSISISLSSLDEASINGDRPIDASNVQRKGPRAAVLRGESGLHGIDNGLKQSERVVGVQNVELEERGLRSAGRDRRRSEVGRTEKASSVGGRR